MASRFSVCNSDSGGRFGRQSGGSAASTSMNLAARGGAPMGENSDRMAAVRRDLIGTNSRRGSTSPETPRAGQVEEYGKPYQEAEPPGWDQAELISPPHPVVPIPDSFPSVSNRKRVGALMATGRFPTESKDFSRGGGFARAGDPEPDRRGSAKAGRTRPAKTNRIAAGNRRRPLVKWG
jgi:hypothetical protein